jgi:transposase
LTGANPVDRGKAGSKLHVAGDAGGLPISVLVSGANANDATMFEAVVDDIPPIRMPSGRRRRRPGTVHADKAYDHRRCRAYLRRRGIRPRIARRMIESSARLGRHRWTIERTGHGLAGGGGCASAMSVPPSGSMRWCCWPVGSSASTRSSSHPANHSQSPVRLVGKDSSPSPHEPARTGWRRSVPFRSRQQATQRWPVACVG